MSSFTRSILGTPRLGFASCILPAVRSYIHAFYLPVQESILVDYLVLSKTAYDFSLLLTPPIAGLISGTPRVAVPLQISLCTECKIMVGLPFRLPQFLLQV